MRFVITEHRTFFRPRERFQLHIVGDNGEEMLSGEKVVNRKDLLDDIKAIRTGAAKAKLTQPSSQPTDPT